MRIGLGKSKRLDSSLSLYQKIEHRSMLTRRTVAVAALASGTERGAAKRLESTMRRPRTPLRGSHFLASLPGSQNIQPGQEVQRKGDGPSAVGGYLKGRAAKYLSFLTQFSKEGD